MAKKFLSILGTGNYNSCEYYMEDKKANETPFIQEALIELLCKDWNENDKAMVFLTESARKINWNNSEDKTKRLKEYLNREDFKLKIVDKDIKDGKTIDEIWEIFEVIMDNIEEGDEILFDITHSFRSIPMLAMVILNYAKVVKNIKIKGIYYGAYEPIEYNKGKRDFQIVDLTSLDEILEWSQAINSFLRYGNSEHIKTFSTERLKEKLKQRDKDAIEINNLVRSLNDFTSTIYTCRGRYLEYSDENKKKSENGNSIQKSYTDLQEKIDTILDNKNKSVKPLVPLFSKVQERIIDFKDKSNLTTGIAVVNWSIENNLTQQGYTALEETIKTYICIKFGLDETDKNIREDIVSKSINIKAKNRSEITWQIKEEYRQYIREMVDNLDKEICTLAEKVKDKRNDINHFGYGENNSVKYEILENDLKTFRNSFINIIERQSIETHKEMVTV